MSENDNSENEIKFVSFSKEHWNSNQAKRQLKKLKLESIGKASVKDNNLVYRIKAECKYGECKTSQSIYDDYTFWS